MATVPIAGLQPGLCRVLWETGKGWIYTLKEFWWFGCEGRRRCGFFASFAQSRHFHRQCGAGTGREEPNRLYVPLPTFFPLFPISIFPPFLPDSIGNFSLLLQSSQPLLTHRAFTGCSWLPRSILASRSARSAEQGNNSNSSDNGGPCSQPDRQKYTHTHTQTHMRTVPGSCGGGSVQPGAGLRHCCDAGLCG